MTGWALRTAYYLRRHSYTIDKDILKSNNPSVPWGAQQPIQSRVRGAFVNTIIVKLFDEQTLRGTKHVE